MVSKNLKCPSCKKPIPYRTLKLTKGKCNHCGYKIASSLLKFTENNNHVIVPAISEKLLQ